jgi:hypothetical protein
MRFNLARKMDEEGKLDRDGLPDYSLDGLHIITVRSLNHVRCIA